MKKLLIIFCTLLVITTACDKDDEMEYNSFILGVDNYNYFNTELNIDVTVAGPRIEIDSVFIHVRQTVPPNNYTVFKQNGIRRGGKYHYRCGGLLLSQPYEFWITTSTWDGKHSRFTQTQNYPF